jgi:iron(III) transport system permease protein
LLLQELGKRRQSRDRPAASAKCNCIVTVRGRGQFVVTLLKNSLVTAGLATVLALLFGLAAALATATMAAGPRRIAVILSLIALAIPPFLVVNCWLYYFGNVGVWRDWFPIRIFNIWGAAWLLALSFWPITLLAALSAWCALDRAHFESEPALRGFNLFRWLLWPAARNSIAWAAVLTFVLALNHFAIPAILQVKVLPVEIWIRYSTNLKPGSALAVSWPLMVIPLLALLLLPQMHVRWAIQGGAPTSEILGRQLGTALRAGCWLAIGIVLCLSVGLPLFQLIGASRTWTELWPALRAGWPVVLNSFVFAALAASTAIPIAVLTWRSRAAWGFWAPFLLPGMLLGIALIWLLNHPFLEVIYRSMAVMVLALVLRFIGPSWALIRHAFRTLDPDLLDAAKLEGLRRVRLFRHVYWPRMAPGLIAAWYIVYILCLSDVETTTLLYPPGAETLAIRVFNLLHYGHNAQVNALCLIQLVLVALPGIFVIWGSARPAVSSAPKDSPIS